MADTAKHTPGPWSVYAQPISSKADAILESIEQVQATETIVGNIYLIDGGGKCTAITGCGPTSEANARLIAAAPDLLEALNEVMAVLRKEAPGTALNNHRFDALGMKAYAAIAKAKGAAA